MLANPTQNAVAECFSFDAPKNFEQAMEFAKVVAKTNLVPKAYIGRAEDILVATQLGKELGFKYFQALQSIAVINGMPSLYGDARLSLVYRHPNICGGVREWHTGSFEKGDYVAHCEVLRVGEEPHTSSFGIADAKRAGLWESKDVWKKYPQIMLKFRARGYALRDKFPDILKGQRVAELDDAYDLRPEDYTVIPDGAGLPAPAGRRSAKRTLKTVSEAAPAAPADQDPDSLAAAMNTPPAEKPTLASLKDQMNNAKDVAELLQVATFAKDLPEAEQKEARKFYKECKDKLLAAQTPPADNGANANV